MLHPPTHTAAMTTYALLSRDIHKKYKTEGGGCPGRDAVSWQEHTRRLCAVVCSVWFYPEYHPRVYQGEESSQGGRGRGAGLKDTGWQL